MNRILTFVVVVGIAIAAVTIAAQSGNDLFQKALSKERVDGQLAEAIVLYEQAVRESGSDRALAARALLQMARCYERLGKADAQKTYERLVRDYAEQRASADQARARLQALAAGHESGRRDALARRVWADPAITPAAAISPDGRVVAFADWETGDLAVRDLTTGRSRRLTATGGTFTEWAEFPAFSPNGKQIAYGWFRGSGTRFDLRLIDVAGGAPRTLFDNADVEYVQPTAWMPDGKAIVAVLRRLDRSTQIATIATADGAVRVLKTIPWRGITRMSVSPDGRWLAYDAAPAESSNGDIFLLDTTGARETALVRHPANDLDPIWTPDGSAVVFISDRSGAPGAWLTRVREGRAVSGPQLVKADLGRRNFPLGFAAGAYHYGVQTGGADVSVVTLDAETGKPSGPATVVSERFVGTNSAPGWSPDGASLAFVSDRGARYTEGRALVIRAGDGTQRELSIPMATYRTPAWSEDGRSLLLVGRDSKLRDGLFRLDVASGSVEPAVQSEPGLYVNWAGWMPGGRELIYSAPSGAGGGHLIRLNLDTGGRQELFKADGPLRSLAISPDGRFVAVHGRGLLLIPTEGGAPRVLVAPSADLEIVPFRGLGWAGNGRYILFGARRSNGGSNAELWRVDVQSGAGESTGFAIPALRDLAVDRAGRRLAFASGQQRFELWALENLIPAPARGPR